MIYALYIRRLLGSSPEGPEARGIRDTLAVSVRYCAADMASQASSSLTEIDTQLQSILDQNDVSKEVQAQMKTAKCLNVARFANWVEDRAELYKHFVEPTVVKDEPSEAPRLKMAWRQAEAIYTRSLKRQSEGLQEEPLDEALDTGVQDSVEVSFRAYYNWRAFQPEEVGADILLGRVYREFQKWKPSMFPVAKVKSVALTNSAPKVTKRQVGMGVTMVLDGDDDSEGYSTTLFLYFLHALHVLANTWALAGCYDAQCKDYPGKMAHWYDTEQYYATIRDKGTKELAKHTEDSVIAYCTEVEEELRRKAISFTRSADHVPWGAALSKATKENSNLWEEESARGILRRRVSLAPAAAPRDAQPPSKKSKGGGKGKDQHNPSTIELPRQLWATGKNDSAGAVICKMFNDLRGCKQWCPMGHSHVCDAYLATGKTCLSKSHSRATHNVVLHGAVKSRKEVPKADRR